MSYVEVVVRIRVYYSISIVENHGDVSHVTLSDWSMRRYTKSGASARVDNCIVGVEI